MGTVGDGVCGTPVGRGVGKLTGCSEGLGEWIIATAREVAFTTRSPMMEVVALREFTPLESACCCSTVEKLPVWRKKRFVAQFIQK